MSTPPLTRRRLLSSLDEDESTEWTPSERARFIDLTKRVDAQRDRANIEQGQRILADFMSDGTSYRDAFDRFMADLSRPRP